MKKYILILMSSLMVCAFMGSTFGATEAQASIGDYSTVSGYVLSWNRKQVTMFSKGYKVKVPREAFAKARLKRGLYVSNLTYKLFDTSQKKPKSKKN